jgi:small subunit ribosomal protein S8
MSVTDPIADMLTRIRNANKARLQSVVIPSSHLKNDLAKIMYEEGYIKSFEVTDGEHTGGIIKIYLKYTGDKKSAFSGLKRISKPGLRVYVEKKEIPRVRGGLGTAVISTSKGVMTDKQARETGIGGEVICYIW